MLTRAKLVCVQSICHVLDRVASVKHAPLILVDELATSTSSTDGGHTATGVECISAADGVT